MSVTAVINTALLKRVCFVLVTFRVIAERSCSSRPMVKANHLTVRWLAE